MNKATLSLVALATIGGTVQAQAAMTQDEKQDAINEKKAIIDEIRKTLNAATTTVNGCADVSEQYLIKLSTIAKELNAIYEDDTVLEISTDQINDFNMRIADAESAAITAQKPYTAKKTLTAEYDVLKTLLDSKLKIANDAKYPNAGPQIAKALNDLNVTAILEKIKAYDLAKQDIVNDQTAIEGEIKTATSSINKILESEEAIAALERHWQTTRLHTRVWLTLTLRLRQPMTRNWQMLSTLCLLTTIRIGRRMSSRTSMSSIASSPLQRMRTLRTMRLALPQKRLSSASLPLRMQKVRLPLW